MDVSSETFSAATESSVLCLAGGCSIACRLIAGAAHTPWMQLRIFKAMSIRAERRYTDVEIVVGTPISDGGNNAGAPTKAGTLALMLRPRSMRLSESVPAGITGDKKTPCHKAPSMLTGDGENTWGAAGLPGAGMVHVGESVCLWACGARRHGKTGSPTVAPAAWSVPAAMLLQRLRAAGAVKKPSCSSRGTTRIPWG